MGYSPVIGRLHPILSGRRRHALCGRGSGPAVSQRGFTAALYGACPQCAPAETFTHLEQNFSDCTSYTFELQAYDVVDDMAYTAGLEHISTSVNGQPRSFTLRATQVYRREGGAWKVAHRHADMVTE
nr:nuclear transport factor 2 family protein [Microbacterium sp. B35-30]